MPRGKFVNHKGRSRNFTSPEELEQQRKIDEEKKKWRKQKDEDDDEDETESENESEDGSEDDSEDSDSNHKSKGVHSLIEIENPNRVHKKATQKVTALDPTNASGSKPAIEQLSRREREEIERQQSRAHYQSLHSAGQTEEAKADLARLAIIKQQRAEAAIRREQEKKEKEAKQKPSK